MNIVLITDGTSDSFFDGRVVDDMVYDKYWTVTRAQTIWSALLSNPDGLIVFGDGLVFVQELKNQGKNLPPTIYIYTSERPNVQEGILTQNAKNGLKEGVDLLAKLLEV